MSGKKNKISKAFLAAPARVNLNIIEQELQERGINPITAYDFLSSGLSIVDHIKKIIKNSDLFIAVIPEYFSPNIFVELGLAYALKKQLLLFISPKLKEIPFDIAGTTYVRAEPDNRAAIAFALDQLLASQEKKIFYLRKNYKEGRLLGDLADTYLKRLQEKGKSLKGADFEKMVAEILKSSGVSTITQSTKHDLGIDFAVWSDDLQAITGNPLLIEVKSGVRNREDLKRALYQVEKYRMKSGTKWALLIVPWLAEISIPVFGSVLALTLAEFIEYLRNHTFAEVIRKLRNKQVHSRST